MLDFPEQIRHWKNCQGGSRIAGHTMEMMGNHSVAKVKGRTTALLLRPEMSSVAESTFSPAAGSSPRTGFI